MRPAQVVSSLRRHDDRSRAASVYACPATKREHMTCGILLTGQRLECGVAGSCWLHTTSSLFPTGRLPQLGSPRTISGQGSGLVTCLVPHSHTGRLGLLKRHLQGDGARVLVCGVRLESVHYIAGAKGRGSAPALTVDQGLNCIYIEPAILVTLALVKRSACNILYYYLPYYENLRMGSN